MNQRELDLLTLAVQKPKVAAEWLYERENQLAERDAEIKKQADYIASCKRDGAYWWREASGLGTKNVNLQAQLTERNAEIEQLQAQLKNCSAACKDAEHARNWHYQQYKKIEMKLQAHEKREAALLAFVAADDAVALHNNQELIACSEFASGVAWHRELSQLENTKDEAREQIRRVIDDN